MRKQILETLEMEHKEREESSPLKKKLEKILEEARNKSSGAKKTGKVATLTENESEPKITASPVATRRKTLEGKNNPSTTITRTSMMRSLVLKEILSTERQYMTSLFTMIRVLTFQKHFSISYLLSIMTEL